MYQLARKSAKFKYYKLRLDCAPCFPGSVERIMCGIVVLKQRIMQQMKSITLPDPRHPLVIIARGEPAESAFEELNNLEAVEVTVSGEEERVGTLETSPPSEERDTFAAPEPTDKNTQALKLHSGAKCLNKKHLVKRAKR